MYHTLVFLIAKLCQILVQRLGRGGGTALPGLIAEQLDLPLLAQLASQLQGVILVVGTNGKTTTSRLLSSYLESDDRLIVHNRSGSNLVRGVLSTLIAQANWRGKLGTCWGLFEVDEAVLPKIIESFSPDYIVALNLFRDQLDRYGEVDTIAAKWRQACATLSPHTTLVLNADDPLIASLAHGSPAKAIFFGVDYASSATTLAAYADTRHCPLCGQPLRFSRIAYSHLGSYACPTGDFASPQPAATASKVWLRGMDGSQFTLTDALGSLSLDLGLAGLYNVYNATAALTLARHMKVSTDVLLTKTRHFQAVFGRLEKVSIGGMTLVLVLVKNPTGFNQVIQTLQTDPQAADFWLILNDRFADGRDISWIWDVEVEALEGQLQSLVISGTRAYDMAVRMKYAGLTVSAPQLLPNLSEALRHLTTSHRGTVYCLCTYTAMLELRQLLQRHQAVGAYHAD